MSVFVTFLHVEFSTSVGDWSLHGFVSYVLYYTLFSMRTSRISLILQPPFPMREPHWLAGTTIRRVTGGLLVAVLFVIELLMSWKNMKTKVNLVWVWADYC